MGRSKPYVVQQGDYLEKLAHTLGFDAQAIWNDAANEGLRAKRKPEQLYPGDILYVPDAEPAWLPLERGASNHYEARVRRVPVHLVFESGGRPYANEACVVAGLGDEREMQTDGDGRLSLSVPVTLRELSVFLVKRNVLYRCASAIWIRLTRRRAS